MRDKTLLKEIGERICARRRKLHLTQENLAEEMDVSVQMISNLELGNKAIRPENLIKVCTALNVSADYILTGTQVERDLSTAMLKFSMLSVRDQRILEELMDSLLEKAESLEKNKMV